MKIFDSIRVKTPRLNKFDLTHERKQSFTMGMLVPSYVQEVIPGDRIRMRPELFMRVMPLLHPMMHQVNVYMHYFFVPTRLIWDEWEEFITGGKLGTSAPVHPYLTPQRIFDTFSSGAAYTNNTLWDYLGLPTSTVRPNDAFNPKINALPFRAYQLIWREFFRDQTLQLAMDDLSFASGEVTNATQLSYLTTMRGRCWERDYLTSCLPFAQRGSAVGIPIDLDGFAPIVGRSADGSIDEWEYDATLQPGSGPITTRIPSDPDAPVGDADTFGYAKLQGLGSSTNINDLRRSLSLQRFLEAMARGGSRYVEMLRNIFAQRPDDARMQRPEYLGGMKAPLMVSEVLQSVTTYNEESVPNGFTGDMYGHGMAVGNQGGFSKHFKEHGLIIGAISVLPRTAYVNNIPRMFTKNDRFDYPFPQFANIGEQEVLNSEVFWNGQDQAIPLTDTFGYQMRYGEHKYKESTVHGEFRNTLQYWHMARIFAEAPELDGAFVESDPTTRIFAVPNSDSTCLAQILNKVSALRPLPYYSTPI